VRSLLTIILLGFIGLNLYGQEEADSTSYFTDYTEDLTLKIYSLLKVNSVELSTNDQRLMLKPNSPLSLGVSVNYKFVGLSAGIGLPSTAGSTDIYGKTERLDFQVGLSLKNLGFDSYLQKYKGFYNSNPDDFMDWNNQNFPKLPGMETLSLGASVYYVTQHGMFSNKAVLSRNQVQNVSKGSFLAGVFFNYDDVKSPEGFFPKELPDSIGSDFDLTGFRYIATGISLGYTYTWVISKSFFLNGTIIPGGGYKDIRVVDNKGISDIERHPHVQTQFRAVLGYEHKHFFAGFTGSTIIRNIEYKDYNIDLATEQIRFYVGKRF